MGLIRSFFNNTRKPTGLRGRLMLSRMNAEHAAVSDWGMAQLPATSPRSIAELGCGGGRNAAELLRRYPGASLTAIDYSPESVGRTARVNAAEVASGRCRTLQADVSDLPLPTDTFDLATAFETVYFWPGPVASLREVLRVLKPGGTLLVVNEADGTDPRDTRWTRVIDDLSIYTEQQLAEFLREAGFVSVRSSREERRHWLCLLAEKPV
ncbi:class I SAM-dependent methyltransferase [Olsenella sp. YH-ols2223]|uniref:Class I SAM-dependent methyltransferase n=1 Tax=Olsenella absiana TaxID=3115222 RepID=A0ABU7RC90_9ACTN